MENKPTIWQLGRELFTERRKKVEDAAARDPKKTGVKSVAQAVRNGGAGFEDSPVDLEQIERAYHTDSYIRRAVDRYMGAMFKSGWELKSKNDKASEYVWMRLKLMAEASGKPIDQLFRQMANDYILYSNVYLIKVRAKQSVQVPGMNAVGYTGKQPIAAYNVAAPTTMRVERDDFGNILKYEQSSGGSGKEYAATEIAHLTYRQPTGRAYGVPFIHNVLQDVLLLRQMEDNVYRLTHKHLFPQKVLQVGLAEAGFEATNEEMEEAREEIRSLERDSVIILPERYKLSVLGGEGHALDISNYLKYFRQRVFAGLAVSDSIMGIGDTANKSTSDNMSADLNDGVKDFQENFAAQVQHYIINELLFEGGFDPTLNPDDEVLFSFTDIEQAAKIARENHAMQMFMQNAITFEEMRMEMNRDVTVDEARLHFQMMSVASPEASEASEASAAQTGNQNQPENQNGKQPAPDTKKRERTQENKNRAKALTEAEGVVTFTNELDTEVFVEGLMKYWKAMKSDLNEAASEESVELATHLAREQMLRQGQVHIMQVMRDAMTGHQRKMADTSMLAVGVSYVEQKMHASVERLVQELTERLRASEPERRELVFETMAYRLRFIGKTETYRAFNIGKCLAAKESGKTSVEWTPNEGACERCRGTETIVLEGTDWMEKVPPHHVGCECIIAMDEVGGIR